jgi:FMN phosphatase YigB (HAD superfamily)
MLQNIRTLTFDLDDTLWDNGPVLEAAEQALYRWLDEHYPRITARYTPASLRTLRQDLLQTTPELP